MKRMAIGATVAIILSSTLAAQAFKNNTGTCPIGPSDAYWTPGTKQLYFLVGERTGPIRPFPPIISSLPSAEKDYNSAQSAAFFGARAWMHSNLADTGGSVKIVPNLGPNNVGDLPHWYDNGNERSELWWEPTDQRCDAPALACSGRDRADCFTSGNNRILAADILINNGATWSIVQQNEMGKCFWNVQAHMENSVMHEVGHAYGLGHDSSYVSVMDPIKPRVRNCNFGMSFHDSIMPDDLQGYLQYHKSYSGTRRNLAGTPWWKSGTTGTLSTQVVQFANLSSGAISVPLKYTVHSYYRHATGNYTISYHLQEALKVPTFVQSTGRYTFNASLPYFTNISSSSTEYSARQSIVMNLVPSDVPKAQTAYLLWVQVDTDYGVAETDESDNAFPTNIVVMRLN